MSRCVAAVRGGATLVQLRDKEADDDALLRQAIELRAALAPYGVPLVVNDRPHVAEKAGVGIHVGVSDVAPAVARDLLGPSAVVGWSVEDPGRLVAAHTAERPGGRTAAQNGGGAVEQTAACSYLAASPVWATPTKSDTAAPLGLDGVTALRCVAGARPLVGIGGINTPERAADVIAAGADGVAVVSGVFGAADPEAAARRLRTAVDEALRGVTR